MNSSASILGEEVNMDWGYMYQGTLFIVLLYICIDVDVIPLFIPYAYGCLWESNNY